MPERPYEPEFPCPEDEHIDVDRDGFCLGCGLTTDNEGAPDA